MDEQKPMTEFELCRELHLRGFPQKRHSEAFYFVRPDILVRVDNTDALKNVDKKTTHNVSDNIYYPSIDDFIEFLGSDFQQLAQTVRSGWFAYANSHLEGVTTRSGGATPWLALANVVYAKYLEKGMTLSDIENSDNVHEGIEPPKHD